jgi:hypothetical protein
MVWIFGLLAFVIIFIFIKIYLFIKEQDKLAEVYDLCIKEFYADIENQNLTTPEFF